MLAVTASIVGIRCPYHTVLSDHRTRGEKNNC